MNIDNKNIKVRTVPELLVPVGGMEQLKAAIANGADAVYLGASDFNARINADNFTVDSLREAVDLAHSYGVAVHITMNTLVRDDEMDGALELARELYEMGADALILQDRGLAHRIGSMLPDISLHMSTQGTVTDAAGVKEAADAGFSRVILARELSLSQIEKIRAEVPDTELEIFVHGAICICYSGQCHLSDFIGGRSGNRGLCAQPCRLPYELLKDGMPAAGKQVKDQKGDAAGPAYLLSPGDMCLVDHIGDLCRAGIDSLKIEGRMKSPEYVACVTGIYRKYLDQYAAGMEPVVDGRDILRLKTVFNRGNFTDGYINGFSDGRIMSGETPKNQGIRIGTVRKLDIRNGQAEVKLTRELQLGDVVEIRNGRGSCSNIITYMRRGDAKVGYGKGRLRQDRKDLLRGAGPGDTVVIGDLRIRGTGINNGDPLYKMSDRKVNEELRATWDKLPCRVNAEAEFFGKTGENAVLTVRTSGPDELRVTVTSEVPLEAARTKAADEDTVRRSLSKTGGTPYLMGRIGVKLAGDPAIPAAVINAMRRSALEQLTELRLESRRRKAPAPDPARDDRTEVRCSEGERDVKARSVSLYFYDAPDCADRVKAMLEKLMREGGTGETYLRICVPVSAVRRTAENIDNAGISDPDRYGLFAVLPAVTWSEKAGDGDSVTLRQEDEIGRLALEGIIRGAYIGHPSQLEAMLRIREEAPGNFEICMDESCNLYNSDSFAYWRHRGVDTAVLSHELDEGTGASALKEAGARVEHTVYGRITLMVTEHCPVGSGRCDGTALYCSTGSFELLDRKGEKMPVLCDPETCRAQLLSFRPVDRTGQMGPVGTPALPDRWDGSGAIPRIAILDESPDQVFRVLKKL